MRNGPVVHLQGNFGNHLFQVAAVLDSSPAGLVKFCNCSSSDVSNCGAGTLSELLKPWVGTKFNFTQSCRPTDLLAYKLSVGIGNRFNSNLAMLSKSRFSNFGSDVLMRNDYFVCHGYFQSRLPSEASVAVIDSMLERPEVTLGPRPNTRSLAIHYRRSGFIGTQFGALSDDYYSRALSSLFGQVDGKVQLAVYVFGDNSEGLAEVLRPFRSKITSVSFQRGSAASDFQMMRSAEMMILSNSTFAYWAATLNTRAGSNRGLIFCPSPYYSAQPFDQKVPKRWTALPSSFMD